MKSFLRLLLCGTIVLIIYRRSSAQTEIAPFISSPSFNTLSIPQPVKIVSFHANRAENKVLMQWVIAGNETADQFEVEKSRDGKSFSTVALVFGTDKEQTETYKFYEKSSSQKVSYRIKCIDKKQNITYSDILVIDPQ